MFTFVSGNLALDFCGTVRGRTTRAEEQLPVPERLSEWFVAAGLLDTTPRVDATALARAVELREAVYRMAFEGIVENQRIDDADRALVNEIARGPLPVVALRPDGTIRRTGDTDTALAAIARAAVELLGGPDAPRVKQCGRDDCTRLYVDTSRAGSRRWCDMTQCGNRAKSAAFRARHTER
ncbi:CGNR zinc finger domain-containing protein [Nocardia sp. NPDC050406]|uniref:CGNR zinc finger domain-containing protein n=1 Tax=Nocardia sp. NPDC050406 TaxID=3364318 RepID=UPI00378CFA28